MLLYRFQMFFSFDILLLRDTLFHLFILEDTKLELYLKDKKAILKCYYNPQQILDARSSFGLNNFTYLNNYGFRTFCSLFVEILWSKYRQEYTFIAFEKNPSWRIMTTLKKCPVTKASKIHWKRNWWKSFHFQIDMFFFRNKSYHCSSIDLLNMYSKNQTNEWSGFRTGINKLALQNRAKVSEVKRRSQWRVFRKEKLVGQWKFGWQKEWKEKTKDTTKAMDWVCRKSCWSMISVFTYGNNLLHK